MKHTMIDCYGASRYKLDDVLMVNDVVNYLATYLGVKPIAPPTLIPYYYGDDDEDSGVSSYLFLKGGHITIHTFPQRECYFLDIIYDGFFEAERLVNFLEKELPFERATSTVTTVDRRVKQQSITESQKTDFGPHVLAKIKINKTVTMENISDFLEGIVEKINMHPITRAFVIKDNVQNPNYLSGMIMIAESHIGIHYNLKEQIMYFDLFSCSMFDSSGLSRMLESEFGELISYTIIVRGTKYDYKRATKLNGNMKYCSQEWTKK
jgi:S-adenosylmethionine/arginine decarboxylase-like enzyme